MVTEQSLQASNLEPAPLAVQRIDYRCHMAAEPAVYTHMFPYKLLICLT